MCSSCPTIDAPAAAPFAERLTGILNGGALSLMISVGHRTGLFDTLAGRAPTNSADLAAAAGLNERYVREWLGAMTAGGIVHSAVGSGLFALPDEHAAFLTRAATPGNMAVPAQFLPMLARVEDPIVDCFRDGGGLPYEAFPRFHEIMAEESEQTVVSVLLSHVIPLVPGLADALRAGREVADVGCGSGLALMQLATSFPASRFTGYDASQEAIARARESAQRRGLSNVRFVVQDAATLVDEQRFDLVTAFDAVHDQVDPAAMLSGIRRALKPDGLFLMQDIEGHSDPARNTEHPLGPFLYTISCMHCMTVSLAKGGAGLGAMWGVDTAEAMLRDAGFVDQHVHRLEHDAMNAWTVARVS
ncbi:MAG: transcriptional regulator [Planctomycetota bacterium]|nr:MAG: transcriptional regulator [Planctomycetota bacterium]